MKLYVESQESSNLMAHFGLPVFNHVRSAYSHRVGIVELRVEGSQAIILQTVEADRHELCIDKSKERLTSQGRKGSPGLRLSSRHGSRD